MPDEGGRGGGGLLTARLARRPIESLLLPAVMALDGLTIIIVVMSGSGYGSTREGGTVQWSNEIGLEVG